MIQVYYGMGKGKTTAAIGAALRAQGAGRQVLFISFLKDNSSSERYATSDITFFKNPKSIEFLFNMNDEQKAKYKLWCESVIENAFQSEYDFIVLDEFLDVISLLGQDFVESLTFDPKKEYVITGHVEDDYIFGIADYLTEMKKIKHPFDNGVIARKGIEF